MDIDMHSENDLMDIVQAGDDPSVVSSFTYFAVLLIRS